MREQLGFRAALLISDKEIQIQLTHVEATPIETTLPTILPTSRIPEVDISLQYRAKDNVVKGDYLALVTYAALLKFWGDKIASVAPSVGRVGYSQVQQILGHSMRGAKLVSQYLLNLRVHEAS